MQQHYSICLSLTIPDVPKLFSHTAYLWTLIMGVMSSEQFNQRGIFPSFLVLNKSNFTRKKFKGQKVGHHFLSLQISSSHCGGLNPQVGNHWTMLWCVLLAVILLLSGAAWHAAFGTSQHKILLVRKIFCCTRCFKKSDAPVKNISSDMEVNAWAILPPTGLWQAYMNVNL